MLKIDSIVVNYGHFEVLRNLSLEVQKGEIVALLGSNGAGKTTTINTISGMTPLTSGDIYFKGESIKNIMAHERVNKGIVVCPEGRKLFPFMTVYDNLLIGSYNKHSKANREENLEKCFQLFPKMKERRNQLAGSLSGGEQQMCAISRALMADPEILMLDEPSLGLAPIIVEKILETMVEINKTGLTILLVEQNVVASLEIASRGYVIENGVNSLSGDAQELLNNEEMKKAYLGI